MTAASRRERAELIIRTITSPFSFDFEEFVFVIIFVYGFVYGFVYAFVYRFVYRFV